MIVFPAINRRRFATVASAALLAGCAGDAATPAPASVGAAPAQPTPPQPSAPTEVISGRPVGRVEITQTSVSMVGSAAWGSGTLQFKGRRHGFRIQGLGFGGFGVSRLTATGDVYGLTELAQFAGLYGQLRAGVVVADVAAMDGGVWLRNPSGVSLYLRARREGIALQLGADGVLVSFS